MRHDESYLLDMLVAARRAARFAEGLTYEGFLRSDLHQNGILKVLEIIGEAASRVSAETRTAHPDVPWPDIVGLRNRIVHAYFDVDLALVWNIVRNNVPGLITALERIAPPEAEWRAVRLSTSWSSVSPTGSRATIGGATERHGCSIPSGVVGQLVP